MHPTGAHLGPTPMQLCLPSSPKFMILVMNKYDVGVEGRITSLHLKGIVQSIQLGKLGKQYFQRRYTLPVWVSSPGPSPIRGALLPIHYWLKNLRVAIRHYIQVGDLLENWKIGKIEKTIISLSD